jgi:hypothetical protein
MNRKQALSIVLEGHIITGRVSRFMQIAINNIDTPFLVLVAKEWLKGFPALEAQSDEQVFPKDKVSGSTPE